MHQKTKIFHSLKNKNKKPIQNNQKQSSHYIINKLLISSKHFVIIQINFEYFLTHSAHDSKNTPITSQNRQNTRTTRTSHTFHLAENTLLSLFSFLEYNLASMLLYRWPY